MIAARVLTELADRRVQLVGADAQTLNQIRDRGAWRPHGADRGRRDADRHLGYARHRRSGRGLVVAGQMGAYRAPGRADPDTHEDGQRLRRDDQGAADADQGADAAHRVHEHHDADPASVGIVAAKARAMHDAAHPGTATPASRATGRRRGPPARADTA